MRSEYMRDEGSKLVLFFIECSQYRRRDISLSLWLLMIHGINWKDYATITINVLMSVHKENHFFINKSCLLKCQSM